jgi:hypothetical protein
MRGGRSELRDTTDSGNKTKGGLDKDYAFNWSYGVDETLTLLVTWCLWRKLRGELTEKSAVAKTLGRARGYRRKCNPDCTAIANVLGTATEHIRDRFTLVPSFVFLFVLGLVYLDTWHKWWIAAITAFAIMLAWGGNFRH